MDQGRFHHDSMAFGSPVGTSTGFLPGYLLGNNVPSSPSPYSVQQSQNQSLYSKGQGSFSSPSQSLFQTQNPGSSFSQSPFTGTDKMDRSLSRSIHLTREHNTSKTEKPGAPPVEGLYDPVPSPLSRSILDNRSMDMSVSMMHSPMQRSQTVPVTPGLATPSSNTVMEYFSPGQTTSTPPSPAQSDPFYSQGESITSQDIFDDCWITVFGFPPSATSYILQQFSQYGNIIKHVVAIQGNWMHLRFQSKLQANKALSKNGKIFGNSIMIGVQPCIDKNVLQSHNDKENKPGHSSRTPSLSAQLPTPKCPIRPLTAAYNASASEHQILSNGARTPQKNNNIISKAMEYMLGW